MARLYTIQLSNDEMELAIRKLKDALGVSVEEPETTILSNLVDYLEVEFK